MIILQIDIGLGIKPPGYYVQRSSGLFPAALPEDCSKLKPISKLFELLGTFLAKCIQDGRRVDIPLSDPFLKLMCFNQTDVVDVATTTSVVIEGEVQDEVQACTTPNVSNKNASRNTDVDTSAEAKGKLIIVDDQEEVSRKDTSKESIIHVTDNTKLQWTLPWFAGILTLADIATIDSHRGKFLLELHEFIKKKKIILSDSTLSDQQKLQMVNDMMFDDDTQLPELMYVKTT